MASDSNWCSRCQNRVLKPRVTMDPNILYNQLRSGLGTAAYSPQKLQEILIHSDKDVEDFDAEISRLKTRLIYIEAQKKLVHQNRVILRSLLSPIRRLDREVLRVIFGHVCDDLSSDKPLFTHLPALPISAVCARWRSLVLSFPVLWSNLRVDITPTMSDMLESTLELCLRRSTDSPLSLVLHMKGPHQKSEPPMLSLLARQASRCQSFVYKGTYLLSRSRSFSQIRFPILTHLELEVDNALDFGCFMNTPKLCSLIANGTPKMLRGSKMLTDRLLYVDIAAPGREQLNAPLNMCPNITVLKLYQQEPETGLYSKRRPTPLTVSGKVSSLTCNIWKFEDDGDFLDAMFASHTFPSLTRLCIDTDHYTRYKWPKTAFDGFISRSSCTITSFTIDSVGFLDLDIIDALRLLPSLSELSIHDEQTEEDRLSPITSRLIHHLHGSGLDARSPPLRKLRSLSLRISGTTFDDAALVNMVSSRWLPDPDYAVALGTSCLRSVVVRFYTRAVDEKAYELLYHLDKMGMQVAITGIPKL